MCLQKESAAVKEEMAKLFSLEEAEATAVDVPFVKVDAKVSTL